MLSQVIEDGKITRMYGINNSRTATFVVSASNSSQLSKQQSDYVCSGTNDQIQIQAAIDALPASGGKVLLTEGDFYLSEQIDLNVNGAHLIGFGSGATTVFQVNDNKDAIHMGGDFTSIEKLELRGAPVSGAPTGEVGIYIPTGIYDAKINDVSVLYFNTCGVYFYYANNAFLTNSRIHNCVNNIELDHCHDILISHCQVEGILGISNYSLLAGYCYSCIITGNVIEDGKIATFRLDYDGNNSITGNAFNGIGTEQIAVVFFSTSSRNVFSCNVIMGPNNSTNYNGDGMFIVGDQNNISSNTFACAPSGKCDIVTSGTSSSNSIINNQITSPDALYSIKMSNADSVGTIIKENLCVKPILDGGTNTIIYTTHIDLLMDVLSVSTTHVRSNEDLSIATPITFTLDAQPDVPRTLSWTFDTHAQITEYNMEVIGIDAKGNTVTETWDETTGWSGETNNAFATITSIKMTSRTGTGVGDTMDIGITDVLGLSNIFYATSDVFKIKKNNANAIVAAAQINTTYDTYDMSVIGLGAGDDFTIYYKNNLNIIG